MYSAGTKKARDYGFVSLAYETNGFLGLFRSITRIDEGKTHYRVQKSNIEVLGSANLRQKHELYRRAWQAELQSEVVP
jgi:hypothetical protein